jgi:hypothetical protein
MYLSRFRDVTLERAASVVAAGDVCGAATITKQYQLAFIYLMAYYKYSWLLHGDSACLRCRQFVGRELTIPHRGDPARTPFADASEWFSQQKPDLKQQLINGEYEAAVSTTQYRAIPIPHFTVVEGAVKIGECPVDDKVCRKCITVAFESCQEQYTPTELDNMSDQDLLTTIQIALSSPNALDALEAISPAHLRRTDDEIWRNGALSKALCHSGVACPFTHRPRPVHAYSPGEYDGVYSQVDPDFWYVLSEMMKRRQDTSVRPTFGLTPKETDKASARWVCAKRPADAPLDPRQGKVRVNGNDNKGTAGKGPQGPGKGGKPSTGKGSSNYVPSTK